MVWIELAARSAAKLRNERAEGGAGTG
jgi:hypothetical protein